MKPLAPVSDIMTKNLVKLNKGDSLAKAELLFSKNKIRHIPVVEHQKVVGIVSYSDLVKVCAKEFHCKSEASVAEIYDRYAVEDVMSENVVCVLSFTPIKEVARLFITSDFRSLPVVYNEQLVGIVTSTDVIRYLYEHIDF